MQTYKKGNLDISYTYDADGLRASKTVDGATTTYQYVGDKLYYLCAKDATGADNYEMYFFYDSYGKLTVLKYFLHTVEDEKKVVKDYTYYVATNYFGDVVALYDGKGKIHTSYEYDAWGNILKVYKHTHSTDDNGVETETITENTNANSLAHRNPIRYRSYCYDQETGLYYLQSRYYNPEIGRFLNADVQLNSDITGCNVFAYTSNNPVSRVDSTGKAWWVFASAIVGATVGAACKIAGNIITGKKLYTNVIGAAAGGAISGAVFAASGSLVLSSFAGAAVEARVNEALTYTPLAFLSGSKQKTLTMNNLVNSAVSIKKDIIVNTATSVILGKVCDELVHINSGWFKPQKFTSCFLGKYALKSELQSLLQGYMSMGAEVTSEALSMYSGHDSTIKIFPETYVEEDE